jgi:polar amino acid transport system substrate-binding protein
VPVLTGFDVEIERALARIMGVEILLPEIAWEDLLAALAAGTADIAAGATASEARSVHAYFSKPYRTETDVLILPRGASGRYPFRTIEEMLDTFAKQKFRLGVVAGFIHADERVNAFIADPTHKDQIFPVAISAQNLRNLLAGVIDGFLADRIVAATTAWRRQEGARIEAHPLRVSTDIHFMLSRATQTPQMLAHLNDAIDELRRSGEFRRHDRVTANLRGELYPEIAIVWGLALAMFLEWEGERLEPNEITLGVIVTILGAFLTRMVAIARGMKGWPYV